MDEDVRKVAWVAAIWGVVAVAWGAFIAYLVSTNP